MKRFNLLLRNAIRIMWKFKFLVLQLILLLMIAITILSSVFLSNKSLETSYNNFKKEGVYPQFSVANKQLDSKLEYNLKSPNSSTPNDVINENSVFELNSSTNVINGDTPNKDGYEIYNPIVKNTLPTNDPNKPLNIYGFVKSYEGYNINPTTSDTSVFTNMVYSKDYGFNVFLNTFKTDQKYKDRLYSLYTFYNKGLYDSIFQQDFEQGNFSKLFDESIYAFNPWSLRYNGENIDVSPTGLARLKNINLVSDNIDVSMFNSIYDKNNEQIVGFDNSFKPNLSQIEKDLLNKEVYLNEQSTISPVANQIISIPTNVRDITPRGVVGQQLTAFESFEAWASDRGFWITNEIKPISEQFFNFNKDIFNELKCSNTTNQPIKNYKTISNQEFIFDYKINLEHIEGIPEYFAKNPIPSFNVENQNIFDTSGFFEGQIGIPIIPYLTVSPKEQYKPTEQVLQQPIDYKLGNWIPNYSNIKSYLFSTVGYLKNNVINKLKDYIDYIKNNYNNPDYINNAQWKLVQTWYDNYLSQYDIERFLISKNYKISKSSNFIFQSLDNSAIISENDSKPKVNKIILNSGVNILDNNNIDIPEQVLSGRDWDKQYVVGQKDPNPTIRINQITKQEFLEKQVYNVFKVISNSSFELNPNDKDYLIRFTSWLGNPINTNNWPLYIDKYKEFSKKWRINRVEKEPYGYKISLGAKSIVNEGLILEQVGEYVATSAHTVLLSQNYTDIMNKDKEAIDSTFLKKALLLPANTYIPNEEDLNQDPFLWEKHYIYNPYSQKKEFYIDFADWMSRLPKNVLFSLNNIDYVIIGTGLSPEFMYPVSTSNQFLINNDVPIVYTNTNGFYFIKSIQTVDISSNYWVNTRYKDILKVNEIIDGINNKFKDVYKTNLAYDIEDSKQPDKLLYTRMNFSRNIMHIVFTITITIGVIIALLSLSFLVVLLRSIIKQNLNSFAIGLSNGISKKELVFSFFPMALIPSFIASIIGYVISLFLYPLIANAISSYWVLSISPIVFSILVFGSLFLISSLLMFLTIVVIVYHTLRHPTAVLLSSAEEYKVNKLMQWTKPMFSKMGSLASFRGSFIFKNFGRFLTLTTLMTLFMTFSSMFVSLKSTFNDATQLTIKNKDYNFSIDLYSPTMSNGYYSTFGYDRIGTSNEGFSPDIGEPYSPIYTGWDPSQPRPSNIDANKINYREPLTFHDPLADDHSKDIFYSNLSLPSVSMVSDIVNNLNFFKNKIWIRQFLDIDISFLGIDINPWAWAKKAIPEAILSTVDKRFNEQIFDALSYYYYQFNNKQSLINEGDKVDNEYRHGHFDKASYYWYTDANQAQIENRSLVDDIIGTEQMSRDPKNPDTWNQNGWYFKLKKVNGKWVWKTDINDINFGLPTYASKPDFIKLVVNIISLPSNGLYKEYWSNEHNNQQMINRNSFLGMNFIPFDKEKNQLYTYIDGLNLNEDKSINIRGIDPIINLQKPINSEPKFYLYDQYHNDKNLVEDLKLWDETNFNNNIDSEKTEFPLIINEVVAKKYRYNINDVIRVKINNTYDRFKKRFLNEEEKPVSFKIIGITTSKSEEQYFTTQKVANYLLRFTEPVVKTKQQIFETSDYNAWASENIPEGKKPFDIYTPFNGLITSETTPMLLSNLLCFYSPSGINLLTANIPQVYFHDNSVSQIVSNWNQINKIVGFKLIPNENNSSPGLSDVLSIFSKNYYKAFGTINYITTSLNGVSAVFADSLIGKIMDKTIGDIMSVIVVSFIPTLIIIILLLSFVIIQEARRIIALLKVLGYGDWTNAVSLSFIYYLVLGISLLFNIGLNYLLSYLFSTMTFSLFNIIINPIAPWWIYITTFGCLLLLLIGLTSSIFYKLKKATLTEEINVR